MKAIPRIAASSSVTPAKPKKGELISNDKFKLVQTRRTFEEVAAQLRELLFNGSVGPGDRLPPERELAEVLGIGRPALREALRALEVSGLIELRKGKTGGSFVTRGDPNVVAGGMTDLVRIGNVSIEELFEAREWLFAAFVRPACRRITRQELDLLKENVATAERLHKEGRYEERIKINFEFYSMLGQVTRNPFASIVLRGLTDALRSLIEKVGSDLSPRFFTDRRELLRALEAGDEDDAVKCMIKIVKATERTYKRLEKLRPSANGSGN